MNVSPGLPDSGQALFNEYRFMQHKRFIRSPASGFADRFVL
jgi:hypothetical protein